MRSDPGSEGLMLFCGLWRCLIFNHDSRVLAPVLAPALDRMWLIKDARMGVRASLTGNGVFPPP